MGHRHSCVKWLTMAVATTLLAAAPAVAPPKPRAVLETPGKTGGQAVERVALAPDGKLAAGTGWGKPRELVIWDVATGALVTKAAWQGPLPLLAFAADGKSLLAASRQGAATTIRILDTASGKDAATVNLTVPPRHACTPSAFSPDLKLVLGEVGAPNFAVQAVLFDAATGKQTSAKPIDLPKSNQIATASFSQDGKRVAIGLRPENLAENPNVFIADTSTGELLWSFRHRAINPDQPIEADVAMSVDGKLLGIVVPHGNAPGDDLVRVYDIDTKTEKWTLPVSHRLSDLQFAPDGRSLLAGTDEGVIVVSVADRRVTARLPTRTARSYYSPKSQAVSADSRTVAFSEDGKVVLVWTLASVEAGK